MDAVTHSLSLPLKPEQCDLLKTGDRVLLSGTMLVGRDQVHKRFQQLLAQGLPLPVNLIGETIYYMGPAPAPEGRVIGSCGPTTSARMDPFTPLLLEQGLAGIVGKGPRAPEAADSFRTHGAVYFYAFGGCGALYAERVKAFELIAFEDLGPEALGRITVEDFPAITAIDRTGGLLFN